MLSGVPKEGIGPAYNSHDHENGVFLKKNHYASIQCPLICVQFTSPTLAPTPTVSLNAFISWVGVTYLRHSLMVTVKMRESWDKPGYLLILFCYCHCCPHQAEASILWGHQGQCIHLLVLFLLFESEGDKVCEFKFSVFVAPSCWTPLKSEESDIPKSEHLGSSLFRCCHIEVFLRTHHKDYFKSCKFACGSFQFGAVSAWELFVDGNMHCFLVLFFWVCLHEQPTFSL